MKTRLILCAYNRPELLEKTLIRLKEQEEQIDSIHLVDDCSTDERTVMLIDDFQKNSKKECIVWKKTLNHGMASCVNYAMSFAFSEGFDFVATIDSDTIITPMDWLPRMAEFMQAHPEIGILAPDKRGSYLRLHRDGYDEVEWAVSLCYMVSKRAHEEFVWADGFFFDYGLPTSFDPDVCYRARMLGYRIGLMPGVSVTDLGEGKSTIPQKLGSGLTGFNAKWNKRLFGRFLYKSPVLFLRWEQYPLNQLFRDLLNAQEGLLAIEPDQRGLQKHAAQRVSKLHCTGTHPTPQQLQNYLKADIWVNKDQTLEEIDKALVEGRRPFKPSDLDDYSLREKRSTVPGFQPS